MADLKGSREAYDQAQEDKVAHFTDTVGTGSGTAGLGSRRVPDYRRLARMSVAIFLFGGADIIEEVLGLPNFVRIDRYKDERGPGVSLMWKGQLDRVSHHHLHYRYLPFYIFRCCPLTQGR